jgi:glycosyltransferase involved in cell wall biosynthesis
MKFSVIIPTRDRANILKMNLEAFKKVDFDRGEFEIIVIDDGSTAGTAKVVRKFANSLPVVYLRQPKLGPCHARNIGIKRAKGEYFLFLNDDVFPDSLAFLKEHLKIVSRRAACLGHFDWHPALVKNEVMRFLSQDGPLFNFNSIDDENDCGPRYFITANISVHRGWLSEDLFDERHPFGMEDNELGHRLCKKGLVIRYNRNARGLHYHLYESFSGLLEEMKSRNRSYNYLLRSHPELRKPAWRILGWGAVALVFLCGYVLTGSKRLRNGYWRWQMGYVIRKRW